MNPPDKLLLSSREAANILSISERTLWTITNAGLIPYVRIGNAKRYARSDLLRFIQQQTRTNTETTPQSDCGKEVS